MTHSPGDWLGLPKARVADEESPTLGIPPLPQPLICETPPSPSALSLPVVLYLQPSASQPISGPLQQEESVSCSEASSQEPVTPTLPKTGEPLP